MSLVATGLLASLLAGLATGVGALPAFFFKEVSDRLMSILLGSAAGVMLAATSFSLIVPGIEHGNILWPGFGVYGVAIGILAGAFCLDLVDRFLPHEHFILGHEGPSSRMKKIWLFIIAITIHNFPEGLAVGVGFGGRDTVNDQPDHRHRFAEYAQRTGRGSAIIRAWLQPDESHWYCHFYRPC